MNVPGARLPAANRLLYASGSIGGTAISRSMDLWLLFFYAPPDDADITRRAGTVAVGLALSAVRLVEALDDPLIGYLSDRTRTRWGRRIPYVLAATPLMALAFVFLWTPPVAGESMQNLFYLVVALWFFHLFSTLSGGPMESLLPEIAPREDDRLSIVSWQVALGVLGAVLGLIVASVLRSTVGFQTMAIVMATVLIVSRFIALAGAWRPAIRSVREAPVREHMQSVRRAVMTCMRNDQFVVFLPSFILYNMGVQMITGVLPFLATAVIERGESGSADIPLFAGVSAPPVEAMLGAAILFLVLALPFMVSAARRFGKRWVYSRGMLAAVIVFPLLFFVGLVPGISPVWQAMIFAALIGLPLAPVQTFPNALIADITDYDALQTGMRREATYYATQAMFEKLASALAPALLGMLLFIGSSADNPLGIRLVGPVAGAATLVGYLIFRRYWLPDRVTAETVRAAVSRRR